MRIRRVRVLSVNLLCIKGVCYEYVLTAHRPIDTNTRTHAFPHKHAYNGLVATTVSLGTRTHTHTAHTYSYILVLFFIVVFFCHSSDLGLLFVRSDA